MTREAELLADIMEKLQFYYVTTPYGQLKHIFRAITVLFYKYFKFGELDPVLLKIVQDFIELKKREPITGLEQ
jgi:hypothetical protein